MLLNDCTGLREGILVLGVLAVSWAHCLNSSKDTLTVLVDCIGEVELACSLRELFPFPITFLYRAFWSGSVSFCLSYLQVRIGEVYHNVRSTYVQYHIHKC